MVYGVKGDGFYVTMEKGARAKAEELGVDFSADGPAQFDASAAAPDPGRQWLPSSPRPLCIAATDKQALIEPMQGSL